MESLELAQSNRRLRAVRLAITGGLAMLFLAALLCGLREVTPARADPGIRFVDGASGSDTTDCTNPTSPCATIGYALDQAEDFDTILVAQGTYTENLVITKTVTMEGGYEPGSWSRRLDRYTTIDGNQSGRVIYVESTLSETTVIDGFTITGAGPDATIIDASGLSDRVLHVLAGTVVISGVTIRNGSGVDRGGGILNEAALTLINGTVVNNSAHDGGGIFNNGGTMTLTNCTISGNTADVSGGGIKNDNGGMVELTNSTVSDNIATTVDGGGIDNFRGGTVKLTKSTVSGNTAGRDGGGIDNWGEEDGTWGYSTVELTNSTVSGNSAGFGGGIANQGTVQLIHCTISSNTAYTSGGGINNFFFRTVELTNTIVASQTFGVDCGGDPVTSFGCNLDSDGTCNFTAPCDITNTNPLLGPLQNNGGDTETHALLPGSPAIDAADDSACPATDQRGVARPQGPACDIGAVELAIYYLPIIMKNH